MEIDVASRPVDVCLLGPHPVEQLGGILRYHANFYPRSFRLVIINSQGVELSQSDNYSTPFAKTRKMKKALLYVANRIWLILAIYAASLVAGAAVFAYAEGKSLGDGLWWATVTALTIGYGDLTPATTIGRIAGVAFGHFWIFVVIPMIVANIILHLVEDHNAFTHEEQIELLQRVKSIEQLLHKNWGQAPDLPPSARLGTELRPRYEPAYPLRTDNQDHSAGTT